MRSSVLHILPLTTIVRERTLPMPGKLLVHLNQRVSATEVIAEASWSNEHMLFDVASRLDLSASAAQDLIRCKVGEMLPAKAVLAELGGLFPVRVRTPRQGRVVAISAGQVLLELEETSLKLLAGLPGMVVQTIPERGATIQTAGALVQGVWGNGQIDTGLMLNLNVSPEDALTAERLDASMRGSILMAGQCREVTMLQTAAELPVRGLILSSLSPELLPTARQLHFPILVTDGFAPRPMNSLAYRLLSSNNEREVAINAQPFDRYSGQRPEAIVPLPISKEPSPPPSTKALAPDQQVRILRAPHAGKIGSLIGLPAGLTAFPSGLNLPAAEIRLEDGEKVLIPLVNLEIVG